MYYYIRGQNVDECIQIEYINRQREEIIIINWCEK